MTTQADLDQAVADKYGGDDEYCFHGTDLSEAFLAGIAHARKEQAALVDVLTFNMEAATYLTNPSQNEYATHALVSCEVYARILEFLKKHRARGSEK